MLTKEQRELYDQTVKRLARGGVKDPTNQIISLAEEIERYRDKIYGLQEQLDRRPLGESPEKRPRNTVLQVPYIELRPTCSECGAALGKVAADYTYIEQPNISRYEVKITPSTCPGCGAIFGHIVFQGDPPEQEEAPRND